MAQNMFQMYRMQYDAKHENIQRIQQKPVL